MAVALGSTGTIGQSALKVMSGIQDRFRVVALTGGELATASASQVAVPAYAGGVGTPGQSGIRERP